MKTGDPESSRFRARLTEARYISEGGLGEAWGKIIEKLQSELPEKMTEAKPDSTGSKPEPDSLIFKLLRSQLGDDTERA